MLSKTQEVELIKAAVAVVRGEDVECEAMIALVSSWLDPLRPRDPAKELPEHDGWHVIQPLSDCPIHAAYWLNARRVFTAEGSEWANPYRWWPAPVASEEGAGG